MGTVIKICKDETIYQNLSLARALSCLKADLQILLICRFKLSWSSLSIPSNLMGEVTSATSFPIKNCLGLLV